MFSDKSNSIMAKATGLFFIASAREVLFGIPRYVQCILHVLTSVLLCVSFIFADSDKSIHLSLRNGKHPYFS